jgi:hypothetical protein
MEKIIRRYASYQEAEQADLEYYRNLTPDQRMNILFELTERHRQENDEPSEGFARVYRIVKRSPRLPDLADADRLEKLGN